MSRTQAVGLAGNSLCSSLGMTLSGQAKILAFRLGVALFALLLGSASQLQAALIAYEGFDYATANLQGQSGGLGFSGSWTTSPSAFTVAVTTPGMNYTDSGMGTLPSVGNTAFVDPTAGGANANSASVRVLSTSLATQGAASPTYISYLLDHAAGNRYLGLVLQNSSGQEIGFLGKNSNQTNYRFSSQTLTPGASSMDSGIAIGTTPALLVLRIDTPAGTANDTISLFVNPVLGDPEPTPVAILAGKNVLAGGFDRIALAAGYTTGGGSTTASGFLDEIRIGSTWEAVTPLFIPPAAPEAVIPEPSSLLLFVSALLPLGFRRRHPSSR